MTHAVGGYARGRVRTTGYLLRSHAYASPSDAYATPCTLEE